MPSAVTVVLFQFVTVWHPPLLCTSWASVYPGLLMVFGEGKASELAVPDGRAVAGAGAGAVFAAGPAGEIASVTLSGNEAGWACAPPVRKLS